jgi:hypothetical protein
MPYLPGKPLRRYCKSIRICSPRTMGKGLGFLRKANVSTFASNMQRMIKRFLISIILICLLLPIIDPVAAQCSICTKTAQQLGEGPAKGLNTAILYLAFFPLVLMGIIGYRWWKTNRDV